MLFDQEFHSQVKSVYPGNLDWQLIGVLLSDSKVYTLSYDSKILSGLFEIFCEPLIRNIAEKYNFRMDKSKQNQYPDFTLYHADQTNRKIAVEVKTTYRAYNLDGSLKKFGFTLGSYRSFLRDRNERKGILYPYKDYIEHWIIGFLYSRNPECDKVEIKQIIEASNLKTPFLDIEYFVQEKYKIAGKTPGSGNTTNIGSIKSDDIEDFKTGKGCFTSMKEFETYWRNY